MNKVLSLMHNTAGKTVKIKECFDNIEKLLTDEQKKDENFIFNINWGRQQVRRLDEALDSFYLANKPDTQ